MKTRTKLLMMSGGSVAVGKTTIIEDIFTDTAATSLNLHTITPTNTPATAWTEAIGDWKIGTNKAATVTNTDYSIATVDAGIANVTISVDAISNSVVTNELSRAAGIILRYTNASNYWAVVINPNTDHFMIIEKNNGTETVRAQATVTLEVATSYALSCTASGQSITATLDGANDISYNSAALNETVTVHGIKARYTTDSIDNFKVTT
jgi:hypothetical protein